MCGSLYYPMYLTNIIDFINKNAFQWDAYRPLQWLSGGEGGGGWGWGGAG